MGLVLQVRLFEVRSLLAVKPDFFFFCRWFALVRLWQPWLAPRHGKTEFQIDKDALICSFQNSKGMHMVILGVSGLNNVSTVLRNGELGQVILRVS